MSDAAHSRYLTTRHFASLDGLRCLSIVPVIWHHSTPRPLPGFWGKGPAGVDLFFCISGFLITTLLLRERARHRQRRPGRLLCAARPSASCRCTTCCCWRTSDLRCSCRAALRNARISSARCPGTRASRPIGSRTSASAFPILFSFAWSLCVEQQFYAFWPWIVRYCSQRVALVVMCALIALDYGAEHSPWTGLAQRIITSFAAPIVGSVSARALAPRAPRLFRAGSPLGQAVERAAFAGRRVRTLALAERAAVRVPDVARRARGRLRGRPAGTRSRRCFERARWPTWAR